MKTKLLAVITLILVLVFATSCKEEKTKPIGTAKTETTMDMAETETEIETQETTKAILTTAPKVTTTTMQIKPQSSKNGKIAPAYARELLKYVPTNWANENYMNNERSYLPNAYQSRKVTAKELDNKILLCQAFEYIDKSKINPSDNEDEFDWYTFDKTVMEEAAHKIFGNNVKIKHESFEVEPGEYVSYDKNIGIYSYSIGGGGDCSYNIVLFDSAKTDGKNIYVYSKYMIAVSNSETVDGITDYTGLSLYTDTTYTKKISDLPKEYIFESDYTLAIEYEESMTMYKHTFKQNADGTYYWYSTELA